MSPVGRVHHQFAAWSLHGIGWVEVSVSGKFKPIFKKKASRPRVAAISEVQQHVLRQRRDAILVGRGAHQSQGGGHILLGQMTGYPQSLTPAARLELRTAGVCRRCRSLRPTPVLDASVARQADSITGPVTGLSPRLPALGRSARSPADPDRPPSWPSGLAARLGRPGRPDSARPAVSPDSALLGRSPGGPVRCSQHSAPPGLVALTGPPPALSALAFACRLTSARKIFPRHKISSASAASAAVLASGCAGLRPSGLAGTNLYPTLRTVPISASFSEPSLARSRRTCTSTVLVPPK